MPQTDRLPDQNTRANLPERQRVSGGVQESIDLADLFARVQSGERQSTVSTEPEDVEHLPHQSVRSASGPANQKGYKNISRAAREKNSKPIPKAQMIVTSIAGFVLLAYGGMQLVEKVSIAFRGNAPAASTSSSRGSLIHARTASARPSGFGSNINASQETVGFHSSLPSAKTPGFASVLPDATKHAHALPPAGFSVLGQWHKHHTKKSAH